MAVEKRNLDQTRVKSRNVRARLLFYSQLHPQGKHTSILRRKRFRSSAQFRAISSKENIHESSDIDSAVKVVTPCKHIRFHNKVKVLRIPSHELYPDDMKINIWSTQKEILENARRNTIEFSFDNWDWRGATEDEAMQLAPNGQRVHPVHVRQHFSNNEKTSADVCAIL